MLKVIVLFGQIKMLNKKNFIFILEKLFQQSKVCYDEFNSADGKIGDGDLGITILHGLEEINKKHQELNGELRKELQDVREALARVSG